MRRDIKILTDDITRTFAVRSIPIRLQISLFTRAHRMTRPSTYVLRLSEGSLSSASVHFSRSSSAGIIKDKL